MIRRQGSAGTILDDLQILAPSLQEEEKGAPDK